MGARTLNVSADGRFGLLHCQTADRSLVADRPAGWRLLVSAREAAEILQRFFPWPCSPSAGEMQKESGSGSPGHCSCC